jgi:hypothetical protein
MRRRRREDDGWGGERSWDGSGHYYDRGWPRYVPVAERREKARRQMERQKKKGETLDPVAIQGRLIARTFWGQAWCQHLESHGDYENRLPRGRSYLRNGSVCDLKIEPGRVKARVAGTALYKVEIEIKKLSGPRWAAIKKSCTGGIATAVELLKGRLSNAVMAVITHRTEGLFPRPAEIEMRCSCPDYATMCKHVAATLYGVGARLDDRPELLFVMRGVDHLELIGEAVQVGRLAAGPGKGGSGLAEADLAEVFGVDIVPTAAVGAAVAAGSGPKVKVKRKRAAEREPAKAAGKAKAPRGRGSVPKKKGVGSKAGRRKVGRKKVKAR